MKDYKEFQFGWLIFILIIPTQILITYLFINDLGDKPMGIIGFLIFSSIFILIYSFFYGLTTRVTAYKITVVFGIGFPRRTIALDRIKGVETVKTPWYYGWGIRFFPTGMLYNISGLQGVELKFNDTEDVIRIGSHNPQQLKKEISKRISL